MNVGLEHYLVVSIILFCLGLLGVIVRRNLIIIYMSLELMLNADNLALVAFSRFNNNLDGQVLVFFVITVAAAEVSVGLALIVALYRKRRTDQFFRSPHAFDDERRLALPRLATPQVAR
jgi:NADH-quinone oxidoreductase subunit K